MQSCEKERGIKEREREKKRHEVAKRREELKREREKSDMKFGKGERNQREQKVI